MFRILIFLLCVGCSVKPLYEFGSAGGSIEVDVIAERDGQKLRSYLIDSFRDLSFTKQRYVLSVALSMVETPFAIADDGNARRVRLTYTAHVILKDSNRKPIYRKMVSVSASSNISSAQGEVMLSLYGRNNNAMLKELSDRIAENLKVFVSGEN